MNRRLASRPWPAVVLSVVVVFQSAGGVRAASWIFRHSTYSHDPATAARVNQYAPEPLSPAPYDPNYLQSGYRHIRSSIRDADGSYDRMHIVQTWGAGEWIRPYGEWQFPYRAGATPYGPWGNRQGPWTLPFDSWVNPYGQWNRWPYQGTPYLGQPLGGMGYPTPFGPPGGYAPGMVPPGMAPPGGYAPGAVPGPSPPMPHGSPAPGGWPLGPAYRGP
jgi:hypothetical protein